MRRRRYVAAAGATSLGSLTGCLGLFGGGETTEAEVAMEDFLAAIREGDRRAANDLIADDGEIGRWGQAAIVELSAFEPRLVGFDVVERAEGRVVADVTVEVQGARGSPRDTFRYEFREVDGEWKLWRAVDGGLR